MRWKTGCRSFSLVPDVIGHRSLRARGTAEITDRYEVVTTDAIQIATWNGPTAKMHAAKFQSHACVLCQRRKLRCDGKLPCQTCRDTLRPDECEYRGKVLSGKFRPVERGSQGASRDSSRSTNTSSRSGSSYSAPQESRRDSADNIPTHPDPALLDTARYESQFLGVIGLSESWTSTAGDISSLPALGDPIQGSTSRPALPQDSTVDQEAELFAVRNLFLDHAWSYGLDIPAEKLDALSRGDISGLVVHPLLVNVCQLLGYLMASHLPSETWLYLEGQTTGEAAQASVIQDALQKTPNTLDLTTAMQVYTLLTKYYALKGDVITSAQAFDRLGNIVVQNITDLKFDDTLPSSTVSLPQLSAEETRAAFSGMIWLDLGRMVVVNLSPGLDPSIWAKFRQLAATHQTCTEINFLRAKSALVLYDTRQLVVDWGRWHVGHPASTLWEMRHSNLIEDIHVHLNVIDTPVLEQIFIHEGQVLALKSCVLVTLGALVELHALFAPFQPESCRKHSEVVQKVATITGMLSLRDFQYLDPTLALCWSTALRPIPAVKQGGDSSVLPHGIPQHGLDIIREAHKKLSQANRSDLAHIGKVRHIILNYRLLVYISKTHHSVRVVEVRSEPRKHPPDALRTRQILPDVTPCTTDEDPLIDSLSGRGLMEFRNYMHSPAYIHAHTTDFLDTAWIDLAELVHSSDLHRCEQDNISPSPEHLRIAVTELTNAQWADLNFNFDLAPMSYYPDYGMPSIAGLYYSDANAAVGAVRYYSNYGVPPMQAPVGNTVMSAAPYYANGNAAVGAARISPTMTVTMAPVVSTPSSPQTSTYDVRNPNSFALQHDMPAAWGSATVNELSTSFPNSCVNQPTPFDARSDHDDLPTLPPLSNLSSPPQIPASVVPRKRPSVEVDEANIIHSSRVRTSSTRSRLSESDTAPKSKRAEWQIACVPT
ncbi:hypothetical protein DFH09DRAFT_1294366 [Mycena vulgaris]|nr:hypothetical protein DFH09DRAFT_1294366 [Mycena vulgaris]